MVLFVDSAAIMCLFKSLLRLLQSWDGIFMKLFLYSRVLYIIHRTLSLIKLITFNYAYYNQAEVYLGACVQLQLYPLAETSQLPLPRIWAHLRGRYRSAKIDDIFLCNPLVKTFVSCRNPLLGEKGIFHHDKCFLCLLQCKNNSLRVL